MNEEHLAYFFKISEQTILLKYIHPNDKKCPNYILTLDNQNSNLKIIKLQNINTTKTNKLYEKLLKI